MVIVVELLGCTLVLWLNFQGFPVYVREHFRSS